jgi:predicted  nucleic acid-binding Zn-ribbon protein
MAQYMHQPLYLYIIGIALLTILLVILCLSIRYYLKAKEIAPFLLQLEDLQTKIATAQNTLSELKLAARQKLDELANAERIIADGNAARQWLSDNESKITALKAAIDSEQYKLDIANKSYEKRQEELNELTQRVANAQIEKADLDVKATALKSHIDALKNEEEHTAEKIKLNESTISELLSKISDLTLKKNELDAQVQNFEQKKKELIKVEEELEKLKAEKETLTPKLNGLKAHMETLQNEIQEETDRLKKLNEDIARLTAEKHSLLGNAKKLEQAKIEAEELAVKIQEQESELGKLKGQADYAIEQIEYFRAAKEMNKERWQDLDRPYIQDEEIPIATEVDEVELLAKFIKLLEQYGFKFNKRTVLGFHTGLKCAEKSPMTVLSGISGTGKSLLPELYAAAFGFNFLPIAVQPRWDSPQDLFGFYNYMEGRYKATELARLVWQYDIYNNKDAQNKFRTNSTDYQLPMNLILLDEMNLARVEYYFSDLLSKLEIRNGIDPNIPNSRRKAEIEFECNAVANKIETRRVYVGLNTLFIGTMNEDESTQTLSDKVLDRSNVLRFGRPQKLAKTPEKQEFLQNCPIYKKTISFNVWGNWGKMSNQTQENLRKLDGYLDALNDAMTKIGRPFGHRINQSITQYVTCYPGDFYNALSDQLEMKILTKLNGIELDTPNFETTKLTILEIIKELNDKELEEAFDNSCDTSQNTFFKWRGVMR